MTLSRVAPAQAFVSRLRLALLLTALSSLTLLAMPTFASANGTIKVLKGGDRNVGNTSVTSYSGSIGGSSSTTNG